MLLRNGRKIGEKAREQCPGGVLIEAENFDQALAATRRALQQGATTIFEGAFTFEGVGIKADVLRRSADSTLELFEVKAGTTPDDYYIGDVAVQA